MATANGNINLTTLDFGTLKQNLITWMQSQQEFKDYNYAASDLNVLIDLLTYNTYLNAWYLNMILGESFLDTCQLKSSAISHAKELNYTPRSFTSAEAQIQLTFNSTSPTVLIQKGQSFSTTIRNKSYTFTIPDNIILGSANGFFSANLNIFEGPYFSDTYIMNSADETQRLVLTNPSCDTSSLTVVVYSNGAVVGTNYQQANTLLGLNEQSQVFFLQQAETGQYEVYFGDNVVGQRPQDGAVVVLDYRVSLGDAGNEAGNFVINFSPDANTSNVTVTTLANSSGGALPQNVQSIQYYAPRHFEVQERAVSDPDFEVVLQEQFPEIQAVSSFGGENLTPPQFRKVVIAVAITGVDSLPDSKITEYQNFLIPRMALTMKPLVIDPDRSFVQVTSTVLYDPDETTLTPDSMSALVLSQVQSWANSNLGNFKSTLYYSKLQAAIDATDPSIVGNDTNLLMYKKISPAPGAAAVLTVLNYGQALDPGNPVTVPAIDSCITSTPFTYNGITSELQDDGEGGVWVVSGSPSQFTTQVGTVNYTTGQVQLLTFQPQFYSGSAISIFAQIAGKDVLAQNETILAIENQAIFVNATPVSL